MKKDHYLPRAEEDRVTWLNNFAAKLVYYAAKYMITPEELMDMQQSALYYAAITDFLNQLRNTLTSTVKHRDVARDGVKNGGMLQPLSLPMMPMVAPVAPGIFVRVASLVKRIKAHMHYSVADGEDLGIEGTEKTASSNNIKPDVKLRLGAGGQPYMAWKKGDMDALEIHKMDENGVLKLLTIDLQPDFIDESPLPPPGKSEIWSYRVIYLKKNKREGQWSDIISITVTG